MTLRHLRRPGTLAALAWVAASAGCFADECQRDADCARGQVCAILTLYNTCLPALVPPDAGNPSCDAPSTERCNGIDDDCDGAVDEPPAGGFPCYPYGQGLDDPTVGRGACRVGTMACHDGTLGACEGAVTPGAELCNGIDDDCSGAADPANPDDGLMQSCARGCPDEVVAGQQAPDDRRCCVGTQMCVMNADGTFDWGPCNGGNDAGERAGEICNGGDDDCDGIIDEGTEDRDPPTDDPMRAEEMASIGFDCVSLGVPGRMEGAGEVTPGACRRFGQVVCVPTTGEVGCAVAAAAPAVERCDETPLPDDIYLPAEGGRRAPGFPEDGAIEHRDEDCDGRVDEIGGDGIMTVGEFSAETLAFGEPCRRGIGLCARVGEVVCDDTGAVASCNALEIPPGVEDCNTLDDDCDGQVDEERGANGAGTPMTQTCGTNLGICEEGRETCRGGAFGGCTAVGVRAGLDRVDWCDGINNDCDGPRDAADAMSDSDGKVDEACTCHAPDGQGLPGIVPEAFSDLNNSAMDGDRANALRGTCGGGEAPEVAVSFTAPSDGIWRFRARSLADPPRDPVVYVTSECPTASIDADQRGEQACADDDGAVDPSLGAVDPLLALGPTLRWGASAVTKIVTDARGSRSPVTVVVDGHGAGDEGRWRLDTRRIDVGPGGRAKLLAIEGTAGALFLGGDDPTPHRRVDLNRPNGPPILQDRVQDFAADNDGIYRALQLDGDALPNTLAPGQRARVQGRLLPRDSDEADWFSLKLAETGERQILDLTLGPPDDDALLPVLPAGERNDFQSDRRRCLGEWTRLAAYVACADGAPRDVFSEGCQRDPLTQHLLCLGDELACDVSPGEGVVPGDAGRVLTLTFAADPCPTPGAELVVFVGVIRMADHAGDCVCLAGDNHQSPTPGRSVTYELTIDHR
ncbi:MAG: hypothetical protein H6701_13065 [Myxococcales bacterium]|nr:hypothetical protein [Myxococcales bacterium]